MGGQRLKRAIAFSLAFVFLCISQPAWMYASNIEEQLEEVRIEGVSSLMPDMNLYCYPKDPGILDSAKISYGNDALTVKQILPYAQTGQGSNYYMLLDISGSVSKEYFARMKESILDFWRNMGAADKLSLVTFGDEVKILFQDKTIADDVTEAIEALENTDQTTHLFEAINQTAKLADTKQEALIRKIMVVFTDGEDFAQNSSTESEALAVLNEKRIPLYAMGAREIYQGGENTYLDGMGEFVRSSGGIMEIFGPEDAVLKMQELQNLFGQAYVMQAQAKTNVVDYQKKPLAITFSNENITTFEYNASYYREDFEAPSASVEKSADDTLKITFSEPVKNANLASSYEIKRDDETITDGYMAYYENKEEAAETKLVFEDELQNGTYEITFNGITDDSMEGNYLKGDVSIEITDGKSPGFWDYLMKYQVFVVGAVVLLVLLAAAAIGWHIIKKRKGIVTIEGKAVLQSNTEKKHHVQVQKKEIPKKQIQFCLEGAYSGKKQITAEIAQSIIIGRSNICDISIEDERMSRQHFAIYDKQGEFYIEDLHTTNGTMVNGRRIAVPTRLSKGDRIQVGEMAMTVRW